MCLTEAAADDSLAAILARNKFGMAIAAMMRMIATTISNSISENPVCRFISSPSHSRRHYVYNTSLAVFRRQVTNDKRLKRRELAGRAGKAAPIREGNGPKNDKIWQDFVFFRQALGHTHPTAWLPKSGSWRRLGQRRYQGFGSGRRYRPRRRSPLRL